MLIELFSLAMTVEALWADICRNFAVWKGVGHWTQISGGKGRPPPTIFGTRKVESLGYRMVKKIAEQFNRLSRVHQRHRRQTDRHTTDGRPIAYSERERKFTSAKNRMWPIEWHHCRCPWMTLTVTSSDRNHSGCHTSWNIEWTY